MEMNKHNLNPNLSFVLHMLGLVECLSNNLQIIRLQERNSIKKSVIKTGSGWEKEKDWPHQLAEQLRRQMQEIRRANL